MSWITRVQKNVFPFSEEQEDIKKALEEWIYEGNMYDLGSGEEDCELCDHPNIRYQFEIVNIKNNNELLIGSECINRFRIGVVDEFGEKLSYEEAKKKVNKDKHKIVTEAKVKALINSLVELSTLDEEFEIDSFIKYFQEKGAFTPKQLTTLIWRFEKYKVSYQKRNFKMTIKRNRDKENFLEMEEWKVKTIWDCLSNYQKEIYENN